MLVTAAGFGGRVPDDADRFQCLSDKGVLYRSAFLFGPRTNRHEDTADQCSDDANQNDAGRRVSVPAMVENKTMANTMCID